MPRDLTQGSVTKTLLIFAGPYFLACFLQTFYGVIDLFIAGLFNGTSTISAIAIGSQIMHMATLIIAGFAVGTNVIIARAFGSKNEKQICQATGNSAIAFILISIVIAFAAFVGADPFIGILQTPPEAYAETLEYSQICFLGIPLIASVNLISAIYRGVGDSKTPMFFVTIGVIINIFLDYYFIGTLELGAKGAAWATVISQMLCLIIGAFWIRYLSSLKSITAADFHPNLSLIRAILGTGAPIAVQDGLVQIGFLVITAIANSRGLNVSTAVGIVEKIVCFFFLVPSAMLASVSAICAQCRGAQLHGRSRLALRYSITAVLGYGISIGLLCQPASSFFVALFSRDEDVIRLGAQYLRLYSFDAAVAGVHFCFSGMFCAYGKSIWSFIHNLVSVALIRVPGTWLAAVLFPLSLYQMGAVTIIGSAVSIIICICVYRHYRYTVFDGKE